MNKAGLACVLALALVGGACASAPVRDGEGRTATPLFVVDGRLAVDGDGTRIDPYSILDVKVLGSEQAMRAYGARGEHGAVLIATRPAAADAGGAGCWLANGCNDVAIPPPRPAAGNVIIRDMPSTQQGDPPLFMINGRGCRAGACGAVSLGDITGVWVVAGPAAMPIYGTAGVNGVVIITTRHPRARR